MIINNIGSTGSLLNISRDRPAHEPLRASTTFVVVDIARTGIAEVMGSNPGGGGGGGAWVSKNLPSFIQ